MAKSTDTNQPRKGDKTVPVQFLVSPTLKQRLQREASRRGVSMSRLIVECLEKEERIESTGDSKLEYIELEDNQP